MAVPQLQLANLGEIFAQNQARQAEMDTMQLQQDEALAARDARQLAATREAKLREALASGIDPSTPEGLGQLARWMPTEDYLKALDTQSKVKLAGIKGETAQRTADAAEMRARAAERTAAAREKQVAGQLRINAAQLGISQQNANATYMKARAAYDKDRAELLGQSAYNLKQLPPEQQGPAYQIWRQQHLANGTFEESDLPPEYDDKVVTAFALGFANKNAGPLSSVAKIEEDFRQGRLSQQQRDAAIAKATTTKGTRTTINPSTGAVVIEEGGMPVGGAQPSIGVSPQQSSILRDIEEIQSIASGEKGPVAEFFATGAPSITGKLGAFTPGGYTKKKLDTVVSNLTLDKLQQIRMASPTGAALGNASDKDVALLKASAGTLSQSQKQEDFLRNISKVKDQYKDTVSGTPSQIVSAALNGKVNVFDAADAIKRDNPQNYTLSVPSLDVIQNLPPVLQSAMSGMQVRDQQTGQTITINAPIPSGGGQGGGWSIKLKQ